MHILSVINCSLGLISKRTSFLMSTSDAILPSLCLVMLTVSVSEIRECNQDSLHISAYFLKSFWDVFCTATWRLCLHSILLNVCQEAYTEDSSPGRSSVCRAEAGPVLDSPPPLIPQVFFLPELSHASELIWPLTFAAHPLLLCSPQCWSVLFGGLLREKTKRK